MIPSSTSCVRQTLGAAALASLDALLLTLAESIADQLDLDADPRESWNAARAPNTSMEQFLRREVLGTVTEMLVWGLDEVDRLFPSACGFGSKVFGLFRSWHNRRILITLSQDAGLTDAVRGLLNGRPCPVPESFYRLRSAGLVTGTSAADAGFRCRLHETYLGRHLL